MPYKLILALCLAALLSPVPRPALAAAEDLQLVTHRINLAGRQRMLTQLMTKSACLAMLGVNAALNAERAFIASVEFDSVLQGLIKGHERLKLQAEGDAKTLALLQEVEQLASRLTPSIRQLASNDRHSVVVRLILRNDDPTLKMMNKAVGRIAKGRKDAPDQARTQHTINEVGRQRMLSQKIAKNVCLIKAGLSTPRDRVALNKDIGYLSVVLRSLTEPVPPDHLAPPPTAAIRAELRRAARSWKMLKPKIERVVSGLPVKLETLDEIDLGSLEILDAMNTAANLWVAQTR